MNREIYKDKETTNKFQRSMLKQSLKYMKPHKKELFFLTVLGIGYSVFLFIMPLFFKNAIDAFGSTQSFSYVLKECVYAGLSLIIALLFLYFRNKVSMKMNVAVSIQLRNELLDKLTKIPVSYYENVPHGKIYNRVVNYVDSITSFLCDTLINFVLQLVTFLVLFIFMFTINISLTILNVILFVFSFSIFILITPKWMQSKQISLDKDANTIAFLSETAKGVFVTQSFTHEQQNFQEFQKLINEQLCAKNKLRYYSNSTWSLSHVFKMFSNISIYIIGLAFFYPSFSIGSILAYVSYSNNLWYPITQFMSLYDTTLNACSHLERIYDLLLLEEEKNEGSKIDFSENTITFQDVSFGYTNRQVIHNLNFTIPSGSKVAIVGATGSGKSTIIQLLTRFYEINKGIIKIGKENIQDISLDSLRETIMILNQDSFLFHTSIYENLILGNQNISLKEVRRICKQLQIDDFIMSLKRGYDTIITNNGANFSIGEKQMLSIARMMVANPKIVILDEATSNIDLATEKHLVKSFFEAFAKKTSIVIAHRLATIIDSDIIFVIDQGRLVEAGTHHELIKKKGYYYRLYRAQTI